MRSWRRKILSFTLDCTEQISALERAPFARLIRKNGIEIFQLSQLWPINFAPFHCTIESQPCENGSTRSGRRFATSVQARAHLSFGRCTHAPSLWRPNKMRENEESVPPLKTGARDNSLGVETALGEIGPAGQLSVRRSAARQAGEGTRLNPDTANPDMAGRGLGTI